jgi:endonuclease YncB( thermonuclease family)
MGSCCSTQSARNHPTNLNNSAIIVPPPPLPPPSSSSSTTSPQTSEILLNSSKIQLFGEMKAQIFKKIAMDRGFMPEFSFSGYRGIALVDKIYDGDTFWIRFPFHNNIMRIKCRTLGYDCSELRQKDFTTDRETFVKSYTKNTHSNENKFIPLTLL